MKKSVKFVFLVLILTLLFPYTKASALSAENRVINRNGIEITDIEYQNLLNLGFTDNEIYNMRSDEYLNNKNLIGHIISQKTIYLDDDNNIVDNQINLCGSQTGYSSTASKTMTTTIVSVNDRFRYKVTLEWKKIPSTRSYDILGIGLDSNVLIYATPYFQQNYCYSADNCSSSIVHTRYSTTKGGAASFKLPSGSLVSLDSYLYFDVVKNTSSTITQLQAYGDYAHATKDISSSNATRYTLTSGGISLYSEIMNYYDTMPVAVATWSGNW